MNSLSTLKLCIGLLATMALTGCIKGETGPQGPPGEGNKVISTVNCKGEVQHASSLDGLYVEYSAVLMSSGDVYATASVSDEYAQYAGTSFYAAQEPGSSNAAVTITYDADGTLDSGFWKISLNRSTLVTKAVYTDASLSPNPVTLTFTPAACTVADF